MVSTIGQKWHQVAFEGLDKELWEISGNDDEDGTNSVAQNVPYYTNIT